MALSNHSMFYYGLRIDSTKQYLDFKEGTTTYSAKLSYGSYTGSKICIEIKKRMEEVGNNTYLVSFDRESRKITISSDQSFDLLPQSGPTSAQSCFTEIGFNQSSDKTGLLTYTAENAALKKYNTQLWLQSYKPTSRNKKAIDPQVNKSSGGVIEVVRQGTERFMSCELNFITSIIQGQGSIVRSDSRGVENFVDFIEWCTEKYEVEFMENENDVSTYQTFILESTEQDQKGLDYELIELYDRQLPEYFRSGNLKFRLME